MAISDHCSSLQFVPVPLHPVSPPTRISALETQSTCVLGHVQSHICVVGVVGALAKCVEVMPLTLPPSLNDE